MPKSIIIDLEAVFGRDIIHFSDIPINAYKKTVKEERLDRRVIQRGSGHLTNQKPFIKALSTARNRQLIQHIGNGGRQESGHL